MGLVVSVDEAKGYLRENFGIDPGFPFLPVFGDTAIEFVDPEWFHGKFLDELARFQQFFHPKIPWWQRLWRADVFDCDDYACGGEVAAQICTWYAKKLYREAGKRIGAAGVFEFWHYMPGDVATHAKIMAMFSPTEIGFVEPITRRKAEWTRDQTCIWYRN